MKNKILEFTIIVLNFSILFIIDSVFNSLIVLNTFLIKIWLFYADYNYELNILYYFDCQ